MWLKVCFKNDVCVHTVLKTGKAQCVRIGI